MISIIGMMRPTCLNVRAAKSDALSMSFCGVNVLASGGVIFARVKKVIGRVLIYLPVWQTDLASAMVALQRATIGRESAGERKFRTPARRLASFVANVGERRLAAQRHLFRLATLARLHFLNP